MGKAGDWVRKNAAEAARLAYNNLIAHTTASQDNWFLGEVSQDRSTITHPNGNTYKLIFTGQIQQTTLACLVGPTLAYAPGPAPRKAPIIEPHGGKGWVLYTHLLGYYLYNTKTGEVAQIDLSSYTVGPTTLHNGVFSPNGNMLGFLITSETSNYNFSACSVDIKVIIFRGFGITSGVFSPGTVIIKTFNLNSGNLPTPPTDPTDPSMGFDFNPSGSGSVPTAHNVTVNQYSNTYNFLDITSLLESMHCLQGSKLSLNSIHDSAFLVLTQDSKGNPLIDVIGSYTATKQKNFVAHIASWAGNSSGDFWCNGVDTGDGVFDQNDTWTGTSAITSSTDCSHIIIARNETINETIINTGTSSPCTTFFPPSGSTSSSTSSTLNISSLNSSDFFNFNISNLGPVGSQLGLVSTHSTHTNFGLIAIRHLEDIPNVITTITKVTNNDQSWIPQTGTSSFITSTGAQVTTSVFDNGIDTFVPIRTGFRAINGDDSKTADVYNDFSDSVYQTPYLNTSSDLGSSTPKVWTDTHVYTSATLPNAFSGTSAFKGADSEKIQTFQVATSTVTLKQFSFSSIDSSWKFSGQVVGKSGTAPPYTVHDFIIAR